jgi:hypothetical protein
MNMARKPKETSHLRIRIEPKLLARLENAREKSGSTLTGEIVTRLEQSFRQQDEDKRLAAAAARALETLGLDVETVKRITAGEVAYTISPVPIDESRNVRVRVLKVTDKAASANKEDESK